MAFRIHESIRRGEIDNRTKGSVRGRIWVHGREEPVELVLQGNAHPDLAGCLLQFRNRLATTPHPHLDSLAPSQVGTIGDLTASRRVRVFDIPLEEALAMIRRKEKPPEHMANCLHLEWFSEANGRVVIESSDYILEISAPAWRLTPAENQQRAEDAAAGMAGFMQKLTEAVEAQRQQDPKDPEAWDEFDYEQSMRESDAMTDKYMELLEKYGDSPEAEDRIAREMGWHQESDEDEDSGDRLNVDEINRICAEAEANPPQPDPLTEGRDWIRTKDGQTKHPLSHRTLESACALLHTLEDLGIGKTEDKDLAVFTGEFQITSAKLAGALDSLCYGRDLREGGFIVAYLKRALDHLHKAQAGLEKLASRKFLPEAVLVRNRKDLFEIREEILRLMQEFRGP